MTIKPIETSDGTKLMDTKTGELRGSIGNGKSKVPTTGLLHMVKTEKVEAPSLATSVHVASERYLNHLKNVASLTTITPVQLENANAPYEQLAFLVTRASTNDLDDVQLADVYRLLYNNIQRDKKSFVAPTDEDWNQWLIDTEAKLTAVDADYSDEEIAHLYSLLEVSKKGSKPDALSYALITRIGKKVWQGKFSLDEGYRQISAWFDVSPVEVKWKINQYRKEYLDTIARGEPAPEIDPGYLSGYRRTSFSAPKDMATVYGHMMAENPELYDPSAVPTKFVAFDTETTGTEPRDSHIIQVGLVEYDHDGNELRRFVTYIRPPLDANGELSTGGPGAIAAHGIYPKDIENAPAFHEIQATLKEYFDGATVIGQNVIAFDQRMLSEEYIRAAGGDRSAGNNPWPRAADTLFYANRWLSGAGLENLKLGSLNAHFDLGEFNAHDAGADAHATAKIFFHIRGEMKKRQMAAFQKRRDNDEWTV